MTGNIPIVHSLTDNALSKICDNFEGNSKNPFKKINIIYGPNSSGKSSIARELYEFNDISHTNNVCPFPQCIKLHSDININKSIIKVFSTDFIKKNLYFDQLDDGEATKIPPISVYLGEDAVQNKEQLIEATKEFEHKQKENNSEQVKIKNKRSSWASNIKDTLLRLGLNKYKSFNIGNIDNELHKLNNKIANKQWDTPEDADSAIEKLKGIIKEEPKKPLNLFHEEMNLSDKLSGDKIENNLNSLQPDQLETIRNKGNIIKKLSFVTNIILQKSITATLIDGMPNNPTIIQWIAEGLKIHTESEAKKDCFFCGQKFTDDRKKELEKYFDESYKNFMSDIDTLLSIIEDSEINQEELRDVFQEHQLYKQFWRRYNDALNKLLTDIGLYNAWLEKIYSALAKKKNDPLCTDEFNLTEPNIDILDKLKEINEIIKENNDYTNQKETAQIEATDRIIELEIYKNDWHSEYASDNKEIEIMKKEAGNLEEEKEKLKYKLQQAYSEVNKKSLDSLNNKLDSFFDHDRFTFHLSPESSSYELLRGDQPAVHLSDGEKNGIALVYFLKTINDAEIKAANTCVVLDDPITSLDNEKFLKAYSFISSSLFKAKRPIAQVIILTHNIKLLRFLRRRFQPSSRNKYYNISHDNNAARISLQPMARYFINNLIGNYKYFKDVYRIWKKGDALQETDLANGFNLVRKLIESFFEFYLPGNWNLLKQLNELFSGSSVLKNNPEIIEEIKSAINEGSHAHEVSTSMPELIENVMNRFKKRYPGYYAHMIDTIDEESKNKSKSSRDNLSNKVKMPKPIKVIEKNKYNMERPQKADRPTGEITIERVTSSQKESKYNNQPDLFH